MNRLYKSTILLSTLTSVLLSACGGGGGGGSTGSNVDPASTVSISSLFNVDYTTIVTTAATAALAFNSTVPGAFIAYGPSCNGTTSLSTVETTNVMVYNDGTVSDTAKLTLVAQFGEASVQKLRSDFGISATLGFDNTYKVRICASAISPGNGSAGFNTVQIGIPSSSDSYWQTQLAQLIKHEMVHSVLAQALRCNTNQYSFEKWLHEGMALRMTQNDQIYKAELASTQSAFTSASLATPFHDTNNAAFPVFAMYPGYRLAIDTFLGELNKSELDVYNFMRSYGNSFGCPTGQAGWKSQFDTYFSSDLRGTGVLGTTFWSRAEAYALNNP